MSAVPNENAGQGSGATIETQTELAGGWLQAANSSEGKTVALCCLNHGLSHCIQSVIDGPISR